MSYVVGGVRGRPCRRFFPTYHIPYTTYRLPHTVVKAFAQVADMVIGIGGDRK